MRGLTMDYQLTVPAIMRRSAMLFSERPIVSRDQAAVHRYRYADTLQRAKRPARRARRPRRPPRRPRRTLGA